MDGSISTASAYGCDVYANVLEKKSSKTTSYEDISSMYLVRTQYTLFDAIEFQ